MKKIKLTQGQYALVDDEDFEYLNQWKWHARRRKTKAAIVYYAVRRLGKAHPNPEEKISMQNQVLKTRKTVDHKDRNPLNNQKSNLRECTRSQNAKNKAACGKSKYLGVSLNIRKYGTPRWMATIMIDGKNKTIGRYNTQEQAALAYNKLAIIHHGEFANLNKI